MIHEIFTTIVSIFLIIESIMCMKYIFLCKKQRRILDNILYHLANVDGDLPHDNCKLNYVRKVLFEFLGYDKIEIQKEDKENGDTQRN